MANKYWVGGTGTWDVSTTTNWSDSNGGAGGAVAPTSSDVANFTTSSGNGTVTITATATCSNWIVNWTNVKTNIFSLSGNFAPSGNISVNGNSSVNRILVQSSVIGTQRTITNTGTTAFTNCDFQDIKINTSVDLSSQTDIGDCGGNSGITFPASVAQTWNGTSGGNWSTNAWTTRVPLPQDDAYLGNAFTSSQTVTSDMPRLGRSIDWTGATGSPTFTNSTTAVSIFGSNTFISGMTVAGTGVITFAGRGSYILTSAGKTYTQALTFACPTGTYTLQDALTTNGAFTSNNGVFNSGTFNITSASFVSNSGFTRSNSINGSTITPNASSGNFISFSTSGLTLEANTTTWSIPQSSSTRTFNGGGLTHGIITYTVAGSTGELDITGSNSFAQINFSDASNARSLKFTAGTTTTIRNGNGFNVRGTAGKLMTIDTITGASTFTLTSANVQSTDYIIPTRSTVNASPKWYAGANSTDGTGNTNWLFQAGYALSTAGFNQTLNEIEYSAYENVNGVGRLSLSEQKLKYFIYKLGYTPSSVRDGEIALLRLLTSSTGTDIRAMWNKYGTQLGLSSLNTEEEIKKSVFINLGLPY